MRDKIALVTGGSRGIGRAIALRLKKEGAHVAFLYAGNGQAAQNTLEELKALGGKAMAIQCDISDLAQVQDAFARNKQEWGTVDILVNNAGITMDGLTPRMTQEAFDRVIQVNLNGAFYLIRTAYGDLLRKRWGRIVNISSVSGLMGNPGQANYSAAKAGLIGLTKTIAKELAARNIGSSVHFIPIHMHPYFRDTYGWREGDFPVAENAYKRAISLPLHPGLTDGDVDDVSEAVLDICREYSR
jgi:3-oxoacyl-[acyl-carrier protein] reductase